MPRSGSFLLLLAFALVTACGGAAPASEPTPTVPAATSTPLPPTATATTTPSVTPVPSPTMTRPTSTPSPSPTAAPTASATRVAENVSPLTGLPLDDPARLHWQPLAIQFDNAPLARPHTGLALASVVVETPTEAGLTRFTAIYLDHDAPVVGPLRSGRLVNLEVIPEHQAVLVSVGASNGVRWRFYDAGLPWVDLMEDVAATGSWRDNSRPAPHNLYSSTAQLRDDARALGLEREANLAPGRFGPIEALPAADAPAGTSVAIPYPHGAVRFAYDAESQTYRRSMGGAPHKDAADGAWIAPRNVVVQITDITATDIIEDTLGSRSLEVRLRGTGDLLLLRDGKLFRGTWQRDTLTDRTAYVDEGGRPLTLAPGQTWIAIVPTDMPVTVEGD